MSFDKALQSVMLMMLLFGQGFDSLRLPSTPHFQPMADVLPVQDLSPCIKWGRTGFDGNKYGKTEAQ